MNKWECSLAVWQSLTIVYGICALLMKSCLILNENRMRASTKPFKKEQKYVWKKKSKHTRTTTQNTRYIIRKWIDAWNSRGQRMVSLSLLFDGACVPIYHLGLCHCLMPWLLLSVSFQHAVFCQRYILFNEYNIQATTDGEGEIVYI